MDVGHLGIYLRVELLGPVVSYSHFPEETSYWFPKWLYEFALPPSVKEKLSLIFLILAILSGVRWYLKVVFICISLIAKDIEHFLQCHSAILISSIENFLFSSVLHFLISLFGAFMTSFLSSLYILEINPLLYVGLEKIFSQSGCCSLVLSTVYFALHKHASLSAVLYTHHHPVTPAPFVKNAFLLPLYTFNCFVLSKTR